MDFQRKLIAISAHVGLRASDVPQVKAVLDATNARHWPALKTVLLVNQATNGDVDVQHWVRDLTRVLS